MKKPIYRRGYHQFYCSSRGYFRRMCRRLGYYLYKKSGGGLVDPIRKTTYRRVVNRSVEPIKLRARVGFYDQIRIPTSSQTRVAMSQAIAAELINSNLITLHKHRKHEEDPYLFSLYCELEVLLPKPQVEFSVNGYPFFTSEYAGKTVRLKDGRDVTIEDWWTTVAGCSWQEAKGNPACMNYAMRRISDRLPIDDAVLYGKIDGPGHLVHITEIEGE